MHLTPHHAELGILHFALRLVHVSEPLSAIELGLVTGVHTLIPIKCFPNLVPEGRLEKTGLIKKGRVTWLSSSDAIITDSEPSYDAMRHHMTPAVIGTQGTRGRGPFERGAGLPDLTVSDATAILVPLGVASASAVILPSPTRVLSVEP